MTNTTLDPATNELTKLADLPTEMALRRAARFLARLVEDAAFLEEVILPVRRDAQGAEEWYVARRYTAEDGSYTLQVFAWPPGTGTKIHNHSSWGAYRCFAGSVVEERYERLDDGSLPDHARLKKAWQLSWSPEDGASTVLPGDGGIHRVMNDGESTAISVHLYGPRMGGIDGRDYDPSQDHVCDRLA